MRRNGITTAEEQLEILAAIWDKGEDFDGWVFLPWIPGTASSKAERRASWNEGRAFHWPNEKDIILKHLKIHKEDDLYFTPNTFLGESRIIQFTGEERVLYADLDEVDPRSDIDPFLKPTIAWETSPGRFQAVWVLDQLADGATEAGGLNHRLTALLGADPSGWDTTQLLRVPGRRNYKFQYKSDEGEAVPGRVLWCDPARIYSPADLADRLPEVKSYATGVEVEDDDIARVDRHDVWGRVSLKLSHTVREYMAMKSRQITEDHDRSEIMWQIERDLADAGCTVAEIVAIIKPSPWNKHAGRNNEMTQLKVEAGKAIAVAQADAEEDTLGTPESTRPGIDELPTLLSLGIQRVPRPQWLIPRIWTKGSVGFLAGAPKSYKSYIALDMAISVATGTAFLNDPQFGYEATPRKVVYIQEEDSLPLLMLRAEQIIEGKAPEAHWAGRIVLSGGEHTSGAAGPSALIWEPRTDVLGHLTMLVRQGFMSSDVGWQGYLLELIKQRDAELVIIDTLATTVGDVDTNKSEQMNPRVFKPLKFIAEATGCAIAIVNHNRKNSDAARSGQNMLGTVAGHAWVESALYFHSKDRMPDTGYTEVKVERENKLAEDLKFRIRVPTMFTERGDQQGDPGRQVWEPEVLMDWGDAQDSPAVREDVEDKPRRVYVMKIVERIREKLGPGTYRLDEITAIYPHGQERTMEHLDKAVARGQIEATVVAGTAKWTVS